MVIHIGAIESIRYLNPPDAKKDSPYWLLVTWAGRIRTDHGIFPASLFCNKGSTYMSNQAKGIRSQISHLYIYESILSVEML